MEIIKDFGFQPVLFIAQIINFLILLYVLNRFVFKPLMKTVTEREHKIKKGLTDAEAAAKNLEEANAHRDEIIKKAGVEAEKILSETKKTAEELRDEILSKAKTEAEKIIAESHAQTQLERENIEKAAKSAALDVSAAILEHALGNMFSKSEKDAILKRSMQQMKETKLNG